jgi:hypothetical protein
MVFYSVVPVAAKVIETEAVCFWIDDIEELGFEFDELSRIHFALEDGVLDALAVVETGFGDPT